jgi:starvation-inducible DNA-binding protein
VRALGSWVFFGSTGHAHVVRDGVDELKSYPFLEPEDAFSAVFCVRRPSRHRNLEWSPAMSKKSSSAPAELGANAIADVVEALTQSVADTSVTQQKAQIFHWNVQGMGFGPLHELFGKIYADHFEAVDELAERVRALGGHAEGRYSEFLKRSGVKESDGRLSDVKMIGELRDDERRLSSTLRTLVDVADEHDDVVTADMATKRAETHDNFAWMLTAHLGHG